jgi:hypothetical protein
LQSPALVAGLFFVLNLTLEKNMFRKEIAERKQVLVENGFVLEELKEYGRNWVSVRKEGMWEYVNLENELDPKFTKKTDRK